MSIARRHIAAVEALELFGHEDVVEIGCGHGVATRLILERLTTGSILALDRSTKMIGTVEASSLEALASGRLRTRAEALEAVDWRGARFDRILAVNVDFGLRLKEDWPALIKSLLRAGGVFVFAFEAPPGSDKAYAIGRRTQKDLEETGFTVSECAGPVRVLRATLD